MHVRRVSHEFPPHIHPCSLFTRCLRVRRLLIALSKTCSYTRRHSQCEQGLMTVAGFGSLLSERSARSTFPELTNFRLATIAGWRRVFAHTAGAALLCCLLRVTALSQAP